MRLNEYEEENSSSLYTHDFFAQWISLLEVIVYEAHQKNQNARLMMLRNVPPTLEELDKYCD